MMRRITGLAVSRGIAMGRAVLVTSARTDVAHYFVTPEQVPAEFERLRRARDAVIDELQGLQKDMPKDAPHELAALLDVHLMLLQDHELSEGVSHWVQERRYNAEWALTAQMEVIGRQFDDMADAYLRERKADLEQVVDRVLLRMKGAHPVWGERQAPLQGDAGGELILVAHDLSPADMLAFKQGVFAGFVTDVGGKTSHTAIVARSLDVPAVVGARTASQTIAQDDWVIIDAQAGVVIANPSDAVLAQYKLLQQQAGDDKQRLQRLLHTPSVTADGQAVELLANIEQPEDAAAALAAGAVGVGLFRTEFLFMGRGGDLPDEQAQYSAYRRAIEGMQGLPVTIRTIDVGADKPLTDVQRGPAHLNPALGLRAIRWCLTEPAMFLVQLRAILRAAAHGPVKLLVPMLAHLSEIRQTLSLIEQARQSLDAQGLAHGPVQLGAMIEVPAAALSAPLFLRHFDFLSIGTNDLIQYTLAIDRADESVAHLYDPLHPAVLRLLQSTIAACNAQGKPVSVCGEMASDPAMVGLLLGLGLRSFSMHPSQVLAIKQHIVQAHTAMLAAWTQQVLASDEPATLMPR